MSDNNRQGETTKFVDKARNSLGALWQLWLVMGLFASGALAFGPIPSKVSELEKSSAASLRENHLKELALTKQLTEITFELKEISRRLSNIERKQSQ